MYEKTKILYAAFKTLFKLFSNVLLNFFYVTIIIKAIKLLKDF